MDRRDPAHIWRGSRQRFTADVEPVDREMLRKTHSNTEQTLTRQESIHGELARLSAVASQLEAASRQTVRDGKHLTESVAAVIKNTSTKNAVIIAVIVSFGMNFGTGWIFDRFLSYDALHRTSQKGDVPAVTFSNLVEPWPSEQPAKPDLMELFRSNDAFLFTSPTTRTAAARDDKAVLAHQRRPHVEKPPLRRGFPAHCRTHTDNLAATA